MRYLPLLAICFLILSSTRVDAKPMLIGWGDKIAEVSDLPKDIAKPGYKIGLRYNSFRLFFIPIISWDKHLVVYNDEKNEYADLDPKDVEELEKFTGSLASKGGAGAFWARYCNWMWAVLIGLVIAKKAIGGRGSGPIQPRE